MVIKVICDAGNFAVSDTHSILMQYPLYMFIFTLNNAHILLLINNWVACVGIKSNGKQIATPFQKAVHKALKVNNFKLYM